MDKLKAFFQNQKVKTAMWNMAGTALSVVAVYLADLDPQYNIILVPAILALSKWINKTYCSA
jgi:hypothetical protein